MHIFVSTNGDTYTNSNTMKAVYTNVITKQVYELHAQKMNISKAWRMFDFACSQMGWSGLVDDVRVQVK